MVAKQAEQEPFDMDDHPPHRLCECRKCMEYFTPLPDCDAFVAFGKPIAEQTNTQLMEGYRIGLAEMREKCAKVCKERSHRSDDMGAICAAAIRAIKFEGDTGFRPVSEMIAEHKQDPKKAAAIEKAKMRKAEQKPVAVVEITYGREPECYVTGNIDDFPEGVFKLYAAPVRTKDLTDVADLQDAVTKALKKAFHLGQTYWQQADSESYAANKRADVTQELYWKLEDDTRAVIAADREKNK